MHNIFSIADQRTFTTVEVAEFEKLLPSGGVLVHDKSGKIVKPDMIVENDDKTWISRV